MTTGTIPGTRNSAGLPHGEQRMFSWAEARAQLSGLPGGHLNIAYEAIDRHVAAGRGARIAIRWIAKDGSCQDVSYADLESETNRFANLLSQLGLRPGQRVFSLLGRVPALYTAALGALKAGCVFSPLFSAFGPEPVQARMSIAEGRVLVTTEAYYKKKVAPMRLRAFPRAYECPSYRRRCGLAEGLDMYANMAYM